ncbi:MAG: UpxY family transcription antiterminator [Prevotellamassilia sp.]|nr:UpxY family transcription antiterminator [Prevotellamassilia sp.]
MPRIESLEPRIVRFPKDVQNWYVLVVTYRTEQKMQAKLRELGKLEAFVPMRRTRRRDAQGKFRYDEKVAIHNYIFVHTTYNRLMALKKEYPFDLEYSLLHRDVYEQGERIGRAPVVVPRNQMLNFIAVAGNQKERVQVLDAEKLDWEAGQRVRIIGGTFAGVEGIYLRTTKKHERRVVVKLDGIAAVATTALPSVLVEPIED